MARFAVGVDGGQSSTLAVVVDAAGRVLGAGKAGPSNHITEPGGPERCRRAVADSVAAAVKAAGLTLGDVAYVMCGMTGAFPATREAVARALPDTSHDMVHDSVTAFHGATGGRAGAIVIGGTGSVGYGEDGAGNSLRLGGWGYLMGDEGSAYWIALQAVRGIAAAYDGRAPKTALLRLLPEAVAFDFEIVVERLGPTCEALCFFAEFQPLGKVIGPALSRTCIFLFLVELAHFGVVLGFVILQP